MTKTPGAIIDVDLDDLFQDDDAGKTPVPEDKKLEITQAMSKRINEVRTKTEQEVRDKIAKDLGFDTYDAMQKAKDKKIITEAGLDPEQVDSIIGPLLEKRLAEDPRILKLQSLEAQEKKNYVTSQLEEIEKLTGLKLKESDLDANTLALWQKGVDLSSAYIASNPAKIIGASTRGTTSHLATGASGGQTKTRGMTAEEKAFYKSINPSITDEELNKKTVEVK